MIYMLGPRSLWVFDFDGTLSSIVPDRTEARLHRECERMIRFLARSPWNRVAVLSSRALDDIVSRVPVPGVFVGGASGLEWMFPGGHRIGPGPASEALLAAKRRTVFPLIEEAASIPGVEIEDKRWSVAIHYRNATPRTFRRRVSLLQRLRNRKGIKVFRGPEVVEVQMLDGGGKSAGVRRLCRLVDRDPLRERIVYAGDDENDAVAIRWVLSKGGAGIVVGNRITVPKARHVEGPADLARAVRELEESAPERITAKARGGTA
ncbi:MAG: trehalose-phosphatase [Deltaproteobacteria bacterium GWB2_65_81]|nr:MAG: trehalose-phosphatase [Deltaproteobacteria bacterium GWB2_65_81]OGP39804.1 MAG: trehalose-phosphatase [Deltaproteobacteria bacterium GWC2_66_88]